MISNDLYNIIFQMKSRIDSLEETVNILMEKDCHHEDNWDDAKLQREWSVCKRTTANYRKNGLQFFRIGGRIYYSAKHRQDFIKQKKS